MFQSFKTASDPRAAAPRVKALRALLAKAGLQAFLVPRADEHQGEYVPPSAERLSWLTGFTGSAGLACIGTRHAALFVDGRYTVQVKAETDPSLFEYPGLARVKLVEWLGDKLGKGDAIGYDPRLHTSGEVTRLSAALSAKGLKLKPVPRNLVDAVWGKDRPAPPRAPIEPHPLKFAGRPASEKIAEVQKLLKEAGQDAVLLTLPDSIAWLLNIRGGDIPHNPVVLAFALVPQNGKVELFADPAKAGREARQHLDGVARISQPEKLDERLKALRTSGRKLRLDPETAAAWFARALGKKSVVSGADPCIALKARKNAAEIRGARAAHVRDGAALARYLTWLDREAAKGGLDEIAAVKMLEACRSETGALKEIAFDTISGSGGHGAIVHYRVSEKTNRTLKSGELFLLDSGAQYQDGTTDITRTIAIGPPSREMRERFTLVLKGHIAIATARFPKGTRGIDLDPYARRALWLHGLDYDHGTGHGVGSYLSVHEGPHSISRAGMAVLEPGVILSNEPGYYKEGAYGIRIENLVLVTEPQKVPGGDREVMGFETLTLVPIDLRLVAPELLTADEAAWLDAYHARVREIVSPDVDTETRRWLAAATAPVGLTS